MLVGVRQRQEGQIDFVLEVQRPHQFERAAAVGQHGAMRQHHALRRATRAGGVDQARQRARRDAAASARCRPAARPPPGPPKAAPGPPAGLRDRPPYTPAGRARPPRARRAQRRDAAEETIAARAPKSRNVRVVSHRVRGVGRHRHRADRHQRGLGDRVFRPVLDTITTRSPPTHRPPAAAGRRTPPCGRTRPSSSPATRHRGTTRSIGLSGQARARANIIAARFGQADFSPRRLPRARVAAPRPFDAAPATLHAGGKTAGQDG